MQSNFFTQQYVANFGPGGKGGRFKVRLGNSLHAASSIGAHARTNMDVRLSLWPDGCSYCC
jgi:hypothetical protein